MRAWKAVSKTATCGTSGQRSRAARMPARLAGLCSGASGTQASMPATHSSVMSVASTKRSPPCTTRWPTAPTPSGFASSSTWPMAAACVRPPCPTRSMSPERRTSAVATSMTWYFTEELPALMTSVRMGAPHRRRRARRVG